MLDLIRIRFGRSEGLLASLIDAIGAAITLKHPLVESLAPVTHAVPDRRVHPALTSSRDMNCSANTFPIVPNSVRRC